MRILQLTPTFFSRDSYLGGAERYVLELSKALARRADVRIVTFADQAATTTYQGITIEQVPRPALMAGRPLATNPFSRQLGRSLRWADIVHCHQVNTWTTAAALVIGRWLGKRLFVTDLGGGHWYVPLRTSGLLRAADALLLLSAYSKSLWEQIPAWQRPSRLEVIYGGVETERFRPGGNHRGGVLFVGRLLAHKGVEHLIEALDGTPSLIVVGQVCDERYFDLLQRKAAGRAVTFRGMVDDIVLVEHYQSALVTVLPSVYDDCYGRRTRVPELLGLAVLESLASGTPVIVTSVASLPEVVQDGITGFIVPPNDSAAIAEKLRYLQTHPDVAAAMGRRGRDFVLERFTWDRVAERCLRAYETHLPHSADLPPAADTLVREGGAGRRGPREPSASRGAGGPAIKQ